MITATYKDTVLAEADESDVVRIEGNIYFPPDSIKKELFTPSDLHTTCHWKGEASYYNVVDESGHDLAWYYPEPKEGSVERVGNDFKNFVAFYPQVQIS